MQICDSFSKLPIDIQNDSKQANLFYSEEYENNVRLRGQKTNIHMG